MKEYFLHFIGKGLYSYNQFVNESKTLGVNRAFPKYFARKFKFGDLILLAQYHKSDKDLFLENTAIVFGYFVISGLNLTGKDSFKDELIKKLKVVKTESFDGGISVKRRCGSYSINSTHYVEDELSEIVDKIIDLEKERSEKTKLFLSGKYYHFDNPKHISPVKFSRIGFNVDLDVNLHSRNIKDKLVSFIGDYSQKRYYLKRESELENIKKLTEF